MSSDKLTVLAVETATKACSVALIYGDTEYSRHELLPQQHAHRVLPMVDELIAEAGIDMDEIDLLAFGEGPGAFTGIRIASGVIQGLALGWNRPVVAISSLLAMADGLVGNKQAPITKDFAWCSLLDARMGEVYLLTGRYFAETQTLESHATELLSPQQAELTIRQYVEENEMCETFGFGDIESEYPSLTELFADWQDLLPNALSVARLARESAQQAKYLHEEIPSPVYLRNQVADTIEQRKLKNAQAS